MPPLAEQVMLAKALTAQHGEVTGTDRIVAVSAIPGLTRTSIFGKLKKSFPARCLMLLFTVRRQGPCGWRVREPVAQCQCGEGKQRYRVAGGNRVGQGWASLVGRGLLT